MDTMILGSVLLVFLGYSLIYFLLMKILKEKQLRKIIPLLYVFALGALFYLSDFSLIMVVVLSAVLLTLFISIYTISVFSFVYNKSLKITLINVLSFRKRQSLEEIKEIISSKAILDATLKHLQATGQIAIEGQNYIVSKERKPFLIGSITDGLKSLLNVSQK